MPPSSKGQPSADLLVSRGIGQSLLAVHRRESSPFLAGLSHGTAGIGYFLAELALANTTPTCPPHALPTQSTGSSIPRAASTSAPCRGGRPRSWSRCWRRRTGWATSQRTGSSPRTAPPMQPGGSRPAAARSSHHPVLLEVDTVNQSPGRIFPGQFETVLQAVSGGQTQVSGHAVTP
jgi:hypothetical protein